MFYKNLKCSRSTNKLDRLICIAKSLIPLVLFDFSKLTTEELIELVDGIENNNISEARLMEILEPIRIEHKGVEGNDKRRISKPDTAGNKYR